MLAIKREDGDLFAHLSSSLNCKHIILKTALETQQMSNWRVNYHHVPLMSQSTALWLETGAAVSQMAHEFFSVPFLRLLKFPD